MIPKKVQKVIDEKRKEELQMLQDDDIEKHPNIKRLCLDTLVFLNEMESRIQMEYEGDK